jgi:hypothetical protein
VAAIFLALLVLRRVLLRGSSHVAHGAVRVVIVAVSLLAIAGIRLFFSRR